MTLTVETWCEALESGKYQQGQKQLRDGDSFCCLGVACDVSGVGEWLDDGTFCANALEETHTLPSVLSLELGLRTNIGEFYLKALPEDIRASIAAVAPNTEHQTTSALTDLNDAGAPFPLIAKVIRARPKGLFREDAKP